MCPSADLASSKVAESNRSRAVSLAPPHRRRPSKTGTPKGPARAAERAGPLGVPVFEGRRRCGGAKETARDRLDSATFEEARSAEGHIQRRLVPTEVRPCTKSGRQ